MSKKKSSRRKPAAKPVDTSVHYAPGYGPFLCGGKGRCTGTIDDVTCAKCCIVIGNIRKGYGRITAMEDVAAKVNIPQPGAIPPVPKMMVESFKATPIRLFNSIDINRSIDVLARTPRESAAFKAADQFLVDYFESLKTQCDCYSSQMTVTFS